MCGTDIGGLIAVTDILDSLAGLVTAITFVEGTAYALGKPEERVIVVPKEPKNGYADLADSA